MLLKQSTARSLAVFMTDSADHITGKTGLTLTITASKDGAAFGSISPTVTELATGWYKLALTTSHTDTLGDFALHITATGADPTDLVRQVVLDLPGTTIQSVSGAVGSVTGAVGSVTGSVASVTGAVGSVTGAVGSIASGGIAAASFAAGAIDATAIADNAIDRATFAGDTGLRTARSGTAQAGAAGSITLDAAASATTDFYVGLFVALVGGTGAGQVRAITAYNGTTKVATIAPNWATTPDNTSSFGLLHTANPTGLQGNVTGSVGSVTGNVGGNVVGSVASVTARVTANTDQLAGQTVTAAAGVTFPTSVASPTNITAGTITTVTNLTNAPTAGDLTATMKTSVTTAATAATPTAAAVTGAVGSVTGNIGGNVVGSVGSVASGGIAAASFAAGAINAAAIADAAIDTATFAADTGLQSIRSNTAQAGAAGTITLDASASATTDFYVGAWVVITGSTGAGQARVITAYNGSTKVATIAPNWATNPGATSTFAILAAAQITGVQGAVTGSVGSVTGAVGSVTGAVASVTGNVGGNVVGSVASVNGNVGGNVVGSVASVSGAVGSVTGNVGGNVTGSIGSLATQAKADVNAEADTALSDVGVTTTVTGRIDAAISTRLAAATYTAPDNTSITAIRLVSDKLGDVFEADSSPANWRFTAHSLSQAPSTASGPTLSQIVNGVWDELLAGHTTSGTAGKALSAASSAGDPWATVFDGLEAGDILRILVAVAAGKTAIVSSGGGAATVTFRDVADASNIVVATMAGSERTAVALSP